MSKLLLLRVRALFPRASRARQRSPAQQLLLSGLFTWREGKRFSARVAQRAPLLLCVACDVGGQDLEASGPHENALIALVLYGYRLAAAWGEVNLFFRARADYRVLFGRLFLRLGSMEYDVLDFRYTFARDVRVLWISIFRFIFERDILRFGIGKKIDE